MARLLGLPLLRYCGQAACRLKVLSPRLNHRLKLLSRGCRDACGLKVHGWSCKDCGLIWSKGAGRLRALRGGKGQGAGLLLVLLPEGGCGLLPWILDHPIQVARGGGALDLLLWIQDLLPWIQDLRPELLRELEERLGQLTLQGGGSPG